MRHFLTIFTMWIAMVLSAHASSIELPVTPDNLDQQNYTFTISASSTNKGASFHITITAKKEDIAQDSNADLAIVTHTKTSEGAISGTSFAAFTPAIPITLKKEKRVWTADFTVPHESLKTSGLCFIFTELAHDTLNNGKRIAMPSATFYEIKLEDFAK
jgi:hypothetical protein